MVGKPLTDALDLDCCCSTLRRSCDVGADLGPALLLRLLLSMVPLRSTDMSGILGATPGLISCGLLAPGRVKSWGLLRLGARRTAHGSAVGRCWRGLWVW